MRVVKCWFLFLNKTSPTLRAALLTVFGHVGCKFSDNVMGDGCVVRHVNATTENRTVNFGNSVLHVLLPTYKLQEDPQSPLYILLLYNTTRM